ncbi:glycosyltransferase family A protein [Mesorhizobium sp. WSM3224]|uniref:glycosyltransferase family 2 protein n=1 Tax=Mesorhizobium sp. WSM3224 TaxID=1040986 RepID=UPI00040D538B|nr:glycosyltransferase family A protein [Mesorhizobium sp. WSM3224]
MSPAVSALLTTHNRAHLLPRVLGGLQNQTLDQSAFEIVAIDDGSIDDTLEILAGWTNRLPLRIFHQGASGLATAKNLGIFAADTPLLVFLDDDDVLEPEALNAHLATHLANPEPAAAVLGYTCLHADAATPLMRHVTETGCQLFSYKGIHSGGIYTYAKFWGGRSSCKREFLLEHGVFNPIFRFGHEDIELGWRLRPHGLHVIYEPAASTAMIRAISFEDFCGRSYLQGRSQLKFSQIHGDLEIEIYRDIENCLAMWAADWRKYAAVLRHAACLDEMATSKILGGETLDPEFQMQLDAAYVQAFALSRAKGIADAASLDQVQSPLRRDVYGLPGDFAAVKQRIEASNALRSNAAEPVLPVVFGSRHPRG